MTKEKEERLRKLRSLVGEHDQRYYKDANPTISDREYDRIKREMEELEQELDPLGLFKQETSSNPDESAQELPEVGDDRLEEFASHRHLVPMLSLDNTYDETEFFEFDQRLKKLFDLNELPYVVEPKIDGVAVSVTYVDGVLKSAVTRGNGIEGDVITQNLKHVSALPFDLPPLDQVKKFLMKSAQVQGMSLIKKIL